MGADIEIEGPKMRGKAQLRLFIEFTVKFGSTKSGSPNPISGLEFMNKHILQRPEGEFKQPFQGLFTNKFSLVQPVKGLIRSENGESPDEDESLNSPFNLEPEFEFAFSHLFPSQSHSIYLGSEDHRDHKVITNNWRTDVSLPSQPFDIVPCHIDKDTNGAPFSIEIFRKENDSSLRIPTENEYNLSGLSYVSTLGHFSSTLWEMLLDNDNKPKGRTSAPENQPRYLNGGSLSGRSVQFPLCIV